MSNTTDDEAAAALPQVLRIVGSIAAPTTVLTALLFYFGLVYSVGYFRYFGVNVTALDLPVQSYLILSADGLVIPLLYLAVLTLPALWLYQLRFESVAARRVARRVVTPCSAVAGAVLVSLAVADAVLGAAVFPAAFLEARGLSLSAGILLLAYAARLRRVLGPRSRPRRAPAPAAAVVVARWGAVFLLVSIGLFWAVGSYAVGVGTGQARESAADLRSAPDVVLYSEKSLSLQAAGVPETACRDADAAYRFRYAGLKLVPQFGSSYLFLPADWTPAGGVAVLIPRSAPVRLEFGWTDRARGTC